MVNVTIIFGLLVVPYLIAYLFHFHNLTLAGRMVGTVRRPKKQRTVEAPSHHDECEREAFEWQEQSDKG